MRWHRLIPTRIRVLLRPLYARIYCALPEPWWLDPGTKHESELNFWRGRHQRDEGKFRNAHYERLMLAMAHEESDVFLRGKIVADFGCGPRGSLVWAKPASLRIGIDVLVDRYIEEFKQDLVAHDTIYVKSTEKHIPLPSDFVDVLYTLNAIDHVDDFPASCAEILRVLKAGGDFIGSFNLGEPASINEPQCLTEQLVKKYLLEAMDVLSYRTARKAPGESPYEPILRGDLSCTEGEPGFPGSERGSANPLTS